MTSRDLQIRGYSPAQRAFHLFVNLAQTIQVDVAAWHVDHQVRDSLDAHDSLAAPVTRRIALPSPGYVEQLVRGGKWLFALTSGDPGTVTCLDPRRGQAGPTITVPGGQAMAYLSGQLWLACGGPGIPASLMALDPETLATRQVVPLAEIPNGLAVAGGRLWVADGRGISAVEPRSGAVGPVVPITGLGATSCFLAVAASPDGTALWTAIGSSGGAPIPIQLRSPVDGHVLAAADGPAGGLGRPKIAAAKDYAWVGYATGMLGSYVRVDRQGDRLVETPPQWSSPPQPFANGIATHLAHGQLWIRDNKSASVGRAQLATGQVLRRACVDTGIANALAVLDHGRLAVASGSQVLIVQPAPVDQS